MQINKLNKKGMFDQLSALAKGVAVLTITLVVVFLILANLKSNASVVANANATNAVTSLTTAVAGLPGWVPLLIIVVIGALILGALKLFGG